VTDQPTQLRLSDGRLLPLNQDQWWSLRDSGAARLSDNPAEAVATKADEIVFSMWAQVGSGVLCDFCSQTLGPDEALWSYPARDFRTSRPADDVTAHSSGGWAACASCHRLIGSYDKKGLTRRAARMFMAKEQLTLNRESRRALEKRLNRLHADFWRNRLGEPTQLR
jgi:hypothetical protein